MHAPPPARHRGYPIYPHVPPPMPDGADRVAAQHRRRPLQHTQQPGDWSENDDGDDELNWRGWLPDIIIPGAVMMWVVLSMLVVALAAILGFLHVSLQAPWAKVAASPSATSAPASSPAAPSSPVGQASPAAPGPGQSDPSSGSRTPAPSKPTAAPVPPVPPAPTPVPTPVGPTVVLTLHCIEGLVGPDGTLTGTPCQFVVGTLICPGSSTACGDTSQLCRLADTVSVAAGEDSSHILCALDTSTGATADTRYVGAPVWCSNSPSCVANVRSQP